VFFLVRFSFLVACFALLCLWMSCVKLEGSLVTKAVTFGSGGRRIFSPSLVSVLLPFPSTALVTRVVARVYRKRRKAKKNCRQKERELQQILPFSL